MIGDLYPELLEWTAGPWLYSLLQVISSKSRGCIVEYYFKIFFLFTIFGICRSSPFLSTLMLPIIAATICFWNTCVVSFSISTWINFTSNITHCQCASWPDRRLCSSWSGSCLSFSLFICVATGQFLKYAEFFQKSTISPSVAICDACTTFKYEIKQHSINLRQKRVLAWSNSDSLPHLGSLGIPRITEGRWGIWQNYKRILGGTGTPWIPVCTGDSLMSRLYLTNN